MAVIFNSDYQNWPMGGMISYITQTVQMLSDTFEIELWGCSVNGEKPEFVQIGELSYPISVCANAKTDRKLIPNVARCFFGTNAFGEVVCAGAILIVLCNRFCVCTAVNGDAGGNFLQAFSGVLFM
jgi:hypothetical protein